MDDFEKQLKKNGMLLKSIPSKERTAEQCKIAVHQNPKALKLVPYKLQEEILCRYALKKDPSDQFHMSIESSRVGSRS